MPKSKSLRKQKEIWELEHKTSKAIPSETSQTFVGPSNSVIEFVKYLKKCGIVSPAKVVDIGSGKGRNSIYLAESGYEVFAMDYIQSALDFLTQRARVNGVVRQIHSYNTEIDKKWPFEDNFFDAALDSFSSIDIETREGREVYKKEMYRTLKPGGYALVTVVSVDDEWERQLIRENPGREKNSTIWPQNNKFQKDYDKKELREFYQEFEIIGLKEVKKSAHKLGKNYMATNLYLILRKHIG